MKVIGEVAPRPKTKQLVANRKQSSTHAPLPVGGIANDPTAKMPPPRYSQLQKIVGPTVAVVTSLTQNGAEDSADVHDDAAPMQNGSSCDQVKKRRRTDDVGVDATEIAVEGEDAASEGLFL